MPPVVLNIVNIVHDGKDTVRVDSPYRGRESDQL
jgi:hypothetical protein